MNRFVVASLLLAAGAYGWKYTAVDDPQCHDEPGKPVLPPTHNPGSLPCLGYVTSFTIIDAKTEKPVPGYEYVTGNQAIDLDSTSGQLTLVANSEADRVRFYNEEGKVIREEGGIPFALAGDNNKVFHSSQQLTYKTYSKFSTPGTYSITARGKMHGKWEPLDDLCGITITTVATDPPTPPKLITSGGQDCTPANVDSHQEGSHDFLLTPITVTGENTNQTVFFKTRNTIITSPLGWLTASFVSGSGYEVCDKVENMAYEAESEHIYEAKCFDGFAYVDIFAYSEGFEGDSALADTSLLPPTCKNTFDGKVVKYTLVLGCDCANVPDIPNEVIGNDDPAPPVCVGETANTWGDPHIVSYSNKKWDCQEEGEFVLTKAELTGLPYDFEVHSRFTKFGEDIRWSFNSGMVAKQDVKVEIVYGEKQALKSNMFDNLPVNFLVDGVPRFFHEGSGDHRVIVSREGYNVHVYFTTTGISIRILIRPIDASGHITNKIPGSMSTYVCMPDANKAIGNVMGLTGTYKDQYVNTLGQKISVGNKDDFCVEHWCVKDEAETMFTYEAGSPHGFDYYNGCTAARRNRQLQEDADPVFEWDAANPDHVTILEICGTVNDDAACLTDGWNMGIEGAALAAESIWLDDEIRENNLMTPTDNGCCSSDFKTCIDESQCEFYDDRFNCGQCVSDGVFKYLENGSWEYDDEELEATFGGCKARSGTCSVDSDCCPDMTCESGACVAQPAARRLGESVEFVRKDLGETREITPFQSEL